MRSLAKAGHEVHMISAFPLKTPIENYYDIAIEYEEDLGTIDMFKLREFSGYEMVNYLTEIGEVTSNFTLNHPKVKKLLASDQKFDAVVVEVFWMEALYGLGAHFNCPVIGTSLFASSIWTNDVTLIPMEYSYVPNHLTKLSAKMNFFQRTQNLLTSQYENAYRALVHYKIQVRIIYFCYNKLISKK